MQDAYFQEKQDVGTWPEIGYSAPGTAISNKSRYESNVFYFSGAETKGWIAMPKTKLNDCEPTGKWEMLASVNNGDVKIADQASSPHCLELTASWKNLEKNK